MTSWYVEPAFRAYGAIFRSQALKHKHVTYCNITPSPHALPISGIHAILQWTICCRTSTLDTSKCSSVEVVTPEIYADEDLLPYEIDLLVTHAR
jgi:hypothetical protein